MRCPKCGSSTTPSGACMACSWQPSDGTASNGALYWCCSWNSDGKRCHYPGTMVNSTMGATDNRWFCRHHLNCNDPVLGDIVAAESRRKFPDPDWSPDAVRRRYSAGTSRS